MTISEYFTYQFYTWEYRGRGWFVAEAPVHLEPPFIPFFRHGFPLERVDDGKRHTLVSKMLEYFKGEQKSVPDESDALDYETLEPYVYSEDHDLQALVVKMPKQRKSGTDTMRAFLTMLSYVTSTISFEIIASATEIRVQFVGNGYTIDCIQTYMTAYFPQYTVLRLEAALNIFTEHMPSMVVDYGLKHEFIRPIGGGKTGVDPYVAICAVFDRLDKDEQAGIQILFQPALNQWSESILRSVTLQDGSSFFNDSPEFPMLATEKVKSPLYGVTVRAFAQAASLDEAESILGQVSHALLLGSKSLDNELLPLAGDLYDFQERIDDMHFRESHRLGMLLNLDELLTFVHFPSEHINSKKLYADVRKTKAVPAIAKGKHFVIGTNIHDGVTTPVTSRLEDRLKHMHIIGATGTGKSTLIRHLIAQDIENNIGVVVFDPHGDLIDDVISTVPADRMADIVFIDPSDIDYPIGLNILEAHSDIEKEVLSSDLVASFRKYATSWGDQMNAVLGNAILAILESRHGGSLHDLRRFLLEKEFRQRILHTVSDPSILYYWQKEYPILKTNSIGPILTRLDTFLRPRSIRNMVVQKTALNFEQLLNERKIILCKLSQGLIGKENSYLLGSLLLSKIHQAIFRRQQSAIRNPVFLYLDEFQHFITPSITEMLSGIRKYQAGLILSHQDLQQLQREDGEVLNSVLGNSTTRIVFRVGEPDAKRFQDGFSGFDAVDLQNLGKGEAIIRTEQPQFDCSLQTIPPPFIAAEDKETSVQHARIYTRKYYATPKEDVERILAESLNLGKVEGPKKEPAAKILTPVQKTEGSVPVASPPKSSQLTVPVSEAKEETVSTHRYLQTLVKKMGENRGYVATIEAQLPQGNGQVDVLLTKDAIRIAVEICITTDAEWEMHNIAKCISGNYDMIVSLSGDPRQLEKIRQKCANSIPDFDAKNIRFCTPDVFFSFLDESAKDTQPKETVMKGYRVNVTYDSISQEANATKRNAVAKVIMDTMRKKRKKG